MNSDVWGEIIQFLEPIDLLSSLMAICKSIQSLLDISFVSFDDLSKCSSGYGARISLHFEIHDHHDEDLFSGNDHINILGNANYFINLYLLKLAIKLGDVVLDTPSLHRVKLILDESECNLLEFYRSRLLRIQHAREIDSDPVSLFLRYCTIGAARVGKTTFNNLLNNERLSSRLVFECFSKLCKLPNGVQIVHQVWDTCGEERFYNKDRLGDYMTRMKRHKFLFMFCFSMDHEETLDGLNEWIDTPSQADRPNLEIIVGLHPHNSNSNYKEIPVDSKYAVKKAWEYSRSVFVEVDSNALKNINTPSWFLQLKYAYFMDLSKISTKSTNDAKKEETNSLCSLL